MFPVAVVCAILGYTLMYTGLANASNGGKGPTVWEALGWGESPSISTGLNIGGSYGKDLEHALPKGLTPDADQSQVPPTFKPV